MGALAVDGTMEWNKPEVQKFVHHRLVIGAFRPQVTADLNRMSVLFPDFVARAPRQEEHTVIGGIDPDAVLIAHVFDAKGQVKTTYARNIQRPNEVWQVERSYNPTTDGDLETFVRDRGLSYKMHRLFE
jgi:hypothetical protein